jgi:hypothetical protein
MSAQSKVLFFKSYVKPHTRKLTGGKVVQVGGYNNKKVARGERKDTKTQDMFGDDPNKIVFLTDTRNARSIKDKPDGSAKNHDSRVEAEKRRQSMTIITKTAENGITVTIDAKKHADYLGNYITLTRDGETLLSAYEYIDKERWMKPYNPPEGTAALLKGRGKIQPIGQITADLISEALIDFNNLDEIRLPRERENLRMAISTAYDKFSYLREQDYNNDIGFHASPAAEKEIEDAEKALKEFDKTHPEFAAKIAKEKAAKTERQIQSALNA